MVTPEYSRIDGLLPREPVGAVLTIGKKGPSGAPVETDRFFFVSPQEAENRVRPPHPGFKAFNEAEPQHRQQIRGNLVHADRADAFEYHLSAQVLGEAWPQFPKAHPARRPICTGDGVRATRFYGIAEGGAEDWREIECPNERCAFRQGDNKACKPFGRIYFRPRWPEGSKLPTPLVKLTTHSWNSISSLVGFFDHVREQAENLRLLDWSLYGLPFLLTLSRKSQPGRQRAFPVLSISPETDLIRFFLAQRRDLIEAGAEPRLLYSGARDEAESSPDEVERDSRTIRPGGVEKPRESAVAAADADEGTEPSLFD